MKKVFFGSVALLLVVGLGQQLHTNASKMRASEHRVKSAAVEQRAAPLPIPSTFAPKVSKLDSVKDHPVPKASTAVSPVLKVASLPVPKASTASLEPAHYYVPTSGSQPVTIVAQDKDHARSYSDGNVRVSWQYATDQATSQSATMRSQLPPGTYTYGSLGTVVIFPKSRC